MTTTRDRSEVLNPSIRSTRGMTAVELMVSVGLMGIVIVSMLGAFLLFARGAASVTDYSVMSMEGRRAIEVISRDFRATRDIYKANKTTIQLKLPAYVSENWIEYAYDAETQELRRYEYDKNDQLVLEQTLLTSIKDFNFVYFDQAGLSIEEDEQYFLNSIKSVQMNAQSTRSISESEISSHVITPRFMLRNRSVFVAPTPEESSI